jgi:hypothetical protein
MGMLVPQTTLGVPTGISKYKFFAPPEDYGTNVGTGLDDTDAFNAAKAANNIVQPLPGKTYYVRDLDLGNNKWLWAPAATIKAAPGAQWIVRLSGLRCSVSNLSLNDGDGNLVRTTTLAAPALAGATVVTVADASRLVVRMALQIETDHNYERHDCLITAINGSDVTLKRPLIYDTSAGRRLWASFPAFWIGDTQKFDANNVSLQSCPFAVATLPESDDGDGADNGTINCVDAAGAYMFGLVHLANSANIEFNDVYVNGNQVLVNSYVGDGVTTDYIVPEYVRQLKAIKPRIGGVLKTLTTDYTFLNETTIRFNTPPAPGAVIAITNVFPGWMGHLVDCAGKTQASGGIRYTQVRKLGYHIGGEVRDADLQYFFGCMSDSADIDALRLRGNLSNIIFTDESLSFAYGNCISMNFTGSAVEFASSVRLRLMPADEKISGVLGNKIDPVAGTIELDPLAWWGTGPWTNIAAGAGVIRTTAATILPFSTANGQQFAVLDTLAAAANYVTVKGSTAGNAVIVGAAGEAGAVLRLSAPGGLELDAKVIMRNVPTSGAPASNGDAMLVATGATELTLKYKFNNVVKSYVMSLT